MNDLNELIAWLTRNPRVLGIVRYGRRRAQDIAPGGDLDLVVVVDERPPEVESIHFDVGGVPVDLSLRTFDDLRRDTPLSAVVDPLLTAAEVLFDRTGALRQAIATLPTSWTQPPPRPTEAEIAQRRFGHRHALDKVRHRLDSEPLLCQFLLAEDMYWKVISYFAVRALPYRGEREALAWLREHDPEMYQGMRRFYETGDLAEKLAVSERLAELALAPVGGPWRAGEILVYAADERATGLQDLGLRVYAALFDE